MTEDHGCLRSNSRADVNPYDTSEGRVDHINYRGLDLGLTLVADYVDRFDLVVEPCGRDMFQTQFECPAYEGWTTFVPNFGRDKPCHYWKNISKLLNPVVRHGRGCARDTGGWIEYEYLMMVLTEHVRIGRGIRREQAYDRETLASMGLTENTLPRFMWRAVCEDGAASRVRAQALLVYPVDSDNLEVVDFDAHRIAGVVKRSVVNNGF